jgi:hypothetical protein
MLAAGKMLLLSMGFALAGLALGLFLFVPWPTDIDADELDFGQNSGVKSGSGRFSKFVPRDDRVFIGKVPVGIKDLSINLTANTDLDVELWDGDVFVVGWESGGSRALIYGDTQTTGEYNGVQIDWSGWAGVDGNPGHESIRITGVTKNSFSMRAFGYNAGSVRVEYSWAGADVDGPAINGAGRFSKTVPQNGRATIGTIPAGVDSLEIDLTASHDLDIELWDEDIFVVGWQVNGKKSLIYGSSPVTGFYHGVRISWSGWDGVGGVKGTEYIRMSGTTQNSYLVKVFGYQEGDVTVDYRWGLGLSSPLPTPTPTPTAAPTPTPAPTPAPTATPEPTPAPKVQVVRTWVGGEQQPWNDWLNWSPIGVPSGDEMIIIEGTESKVQLPIMNVDFVLTSGTINIGPVNSMLRIREDVTFTNDGTVNAKGNVLNEGQIINTGRFVNEAMISTGSGSRGFTNQPGGVLINTLTGSSIGQIVNACGGEISDLGGLSPVHQSTCLWSGAGGDDNWTNPSNWVNGLVPPEGHPIMINGEGSAAANVVLDINLYIRSRSLTVGAGDTLTIGTGKPFGKGRASLTIEQPGGILTNLGTIVVSNYSILKRDLLATIENVYGAINIACRGSGPVNGVTGRTAVQGSCFWDGGGSTNNWSEAANWDSNSPPRPSDAILIRDVGGLKSVVNLDKSFELNPLGSLTVAGGQTLNVIDGVFLRIANRSPGGSIWINGTLNINNGTLHNQATGLITNRGTINVNGGTLNNEGDSVVNRVGATINNVGGFVYNGGGAWFSNSGSVVNDAASSFVLGDHSTLNNNGAFTTAGLFNTSSLSGNVVNRDNGTLTNSGTFNLGGLGILSNLTGAKITNSGRLNVFDSLLDNHGTVDNTGIVEIFHFGSHQNEDGTLENRTEGIFTNAGSAANLGGGTINNAGSIVNDRNLINAGNINNLCGGSIVGPVSGAHPVLVCDIS